MNIQLIDQSLLRTVPEGAGIQGRVGVMYQVQQTGRLYTWSPVTRTMQPVAEHIAAAAGRFDVPNSSDAVNSFVLAGRTDIPGGAMGPNGRIELFLAIENYSGAASTLQVFYGGHLVWDEVVVDSRTFNIVIANQNSTQTQRCIRGSVVRTVAVNSEVTLPVAVYINKTNASNIVFISQLQARVSAGLELVDEASYHAAGGLQIVKRDDIRASPLPARVVNDPRKTIRSLTAAPYTFPAKFFSCAIKTWPVNSATVPPFEFHMHRTLEFGGMSWIEMQTAQATAAYSNPTGAAPAGINGTGLARMDQMFAACAATGKEMVVNLCSAFVGAPAWMTALGGSSFPLAIPDAGANRTALLNSLKFYARFICERYRGLHPTMNWWIEPLNEPNNPGVWSGSVGDFVALVTAIKEQVDISGGTQVKLIASSWTDRSGITFQNAGSPALGGTRQTLHEYLGNGGWAQFDVLTYHLYGGAVYSNNINSSDPLRQQGLFLHDLAILDPLNNVTTGGRFIGLLGLVESLGLGTTVVPGVSTYGGKPLWITETGDAYGQSRDRNWYIRLALVCSALGVTRYVFYYHGNYEHGALPDMEINVPEYQAAADYLRGAQIGWVNANYAMTKVAALINGQVQEF
jgi:hypothetical protein